MRLALILWSLLALVGCAKDYTLLADPDYITSWAFPFVAVGIVLWLTRGILELSGWRAWLLGVILILFIAACSHAQAATVAEIESLNKVSCEIESRTEEYPDLAISSKGAKGRCQILPATALWLAPHAVRMGYLPADYLEVRSEVVWGALLAVPWVSEAIATTYKQWIAVNRNGSLRMVAYFYHAGQNARWRTGTESWRHSAEVFMTYQARRMASWKTEQVAVH